MTTTPTAPAAGWLTAAFAAAAGAVLFLSFPSPLTSLVLTLVLFGVLHAILELRYVAGRFAGLAPGLGRPALRVLAMLVAGIVLVRLLTDLLGGPGQIIEIALGYAIVAFAIPRVLPDRHHLLAWTLTGAAAAASFAFSDLYLVVLAQVHVAGVVVFLWDWSRRIPSQRGRTAFRAVQVGWAVVVPLAVLAGAADPWIGTDTTAVRSLVGDGSSVLATIVPPGEVGTVLGSRLLAVSAFLQTMHVLAWVVFFPRWAPEATADLEERLPWLTGARVWAIGFLAAAALAVILVSDYAVGSVLHEAVTAPHVYIEIPLLLALLGRRAPARAERDEIDAENPLARAIVPTYGRGTQ